MKKGFTLIELLAVIVILAIIALIATPIVVTLINDSTESTALRSAELYINAVENAIMNKNLEGSNFDPKKCVVEKQTGDVICDNTIKLKLEAEGERPISGEIIYENGQVADINLIYDEGINIIDSIDGGLVYIEKNQICKAVTNDTKTTGNVPKGKYSKGDEYICEIKPGVKYHFFILSTSDEKVNLMLDRNINSDGTLATSSNAVNGVYSILPWMSQTDYITANTDDTSCSYTSCHDEGPITVMNFLNKATSSWENILNLNETYRDEFGVYGSIKLNGKARLAKYSELSSLGCTKSTTCPLWALNYLKSSTYVAGVGLQNISGMNGYWLMSSSNSNAKCENCSASYMYYTGGIDNQSEAYQAWYGVRPVISLYKTNLY